MIKVRFAPSPTGYLHIGGARTALFNWMYARAQEGQFVLRIEDTDRERSQPAYVEEILDSMTWLGLNWDTVYRQSDRFDLYHEYAAKLVDTGAAYREGTAVLLRMVAQEVKFYDLIRGEIVFDTASFIEAQTARQDRPATSAAPDADASPVLKDEVLIKSDGSPTYSFACVVDDALMEISHVIRGEDHISNTPKQWLMYQALGFKPPKFAHLPLIKDASGGRMSKRFGAVAVSEYRRMGFLPDAMVNYLMLLGWAPGPQQEVIACEAAIKKFSIKKINKAAATFSLEKLKWMNAQYIKQMSVPDLANLLIPRLQEQGLLEQQFNRQWVESVVRLYQSRMATLQEFLERAGHVFEDEFVPPEDIARKHGLDDYADVFARLADDLQMLPEFGVAAVEAIFREFATARAIKTSELVHPVRVALTGSDVGPGLFETMAVLGKEKTLARLRQAAVRPADKHKA